MPNQRNLLLAIAAVAVGMVAAAVAMQHFKDMLPCPLCVIQRYLLLFVAGACLFGALAGKIRAGAMVALAFALGGIGVAAKHLYVLAHPGFSCGIDPTETFLNKLPTATYLPWAFRADGLCENATEPLLGLSIPQWAGLSFVVVTIALLVVLARRRA